MSVLMNSSGKRSLSSFEIDMALETQGPGTAEVFYGQTTKETKMKRFLGSFLVMPGSMVERRAQEEISNIGKGDKHSTMQRCQQRREARSCSVPRTMIDTQWGGGAVPIDKSSFGIEWHNRR